MKLLKPIFADVRKVVIGTIFLALVGGTSGLLCLSKTALHISIYILNIYTPLWATIGLVLTCFVYIYVKGQKNLVSCEPPKNKEELVEMFGAKWNKEYKMRCLKCESPLKCSSKKHDAFTFFCSNKSCDEQHALRDLNGNFITQHQAIELLKSCTNNPLHKIT